MKRGDLPERLPLWCRLGASPVSPCRSAIRPVDLYGAIGVKAFVEGHLLVRLAGDISSSRPDFPGTMRAVAVKGGRRPSHSDLPLTGASTASRFLSRATRVCPARSVHFRQQRRYRGELALGARVARHELVFGRPRGSHHDAVMRIGGEAPRGGPILNRGAKPIVQRRVAAASVRRLQFGRRGDA